MMRSSHFFDSKPEPSAKEAAVSGYGTAASFYSTRYRFMLEYILCSGFFLQGRNNVETYNFL